MNWMKVLMVLMMLIMAGTVRAEFGDGNLKEKTKEIRDDKRDIKKATSAGERKEARMELKDDIKERRAIFKDNLKKIKDEKKKLIVEKLDVRFNEVNAKRTAQMTTHLDKMSEILTKVTGDTASASLAIQTARDAVTAQSEKTYVVTISSEANLKMDVGKVRSQLEADLKSVNELVIAARKAVQAVLK